MVCSMSQGHRSGTEPSAVAGSFTGNVYAKKSPASNFTPLQLNRTAPW